jgi:Hint domain
MAGENGIQGLENALQNLEKLLSNFNGGQGTEGIINAAQAVNNAIENVICFMPGTRIAVPGGFKEVETLRRGDLVLTSEGDAKPVSWIGRQTVSRAFADPLRVLPIRITAGALSDNVPSRDLMISPDHAILIGGVLVQAGALVNGTTILRDASVPQTFTYYHVEVHDHSLILAENTPAETFIDNVDRLHFDNWDEHQALYPEGRAVTEMAYPRAQSRRQVPTAVRELVGERERAMARCIAPAA